MTRAQVVRRSAALTASVLSIALTGGCKSSREPGSSADQSVPIEAHAVPADPIEVILAPVSVPKNWYCAGGTVLQGAPVKVSGDVEPDGSWRIGMWGLAGIDVGFTFSRDEASKTHVMVDAVSTRGLTIKTPRALIRDGASEHIPVDDLRGQVFVRFSNWGVENMPLECVFCLHGLCGTQPMVLTGGFSILVKQN